MPNTIKLKGVRVNNLKNIDVEIPRNTFTVITGLSGSGKSSLAFDTLYAEGQRRYVESLSAYARQFLGRMNKPECDYIKGIPPAIAIEQKVNTRNPRSTVGTSTEIYDYLRMLFARIGHTISPISGREVRKHDVKDVINSMLSYPTGTRFALLTRLNIPTGRSCEEHLGILLKEGFSRVEIDGTFIMIEDILSKPDDYDLSAARLLIDRMTAADDAATISRLTDSTETAFFEGGDECTLQFYINGSTEELHFSKRFEADGMQFDPPSDLMFNFNSPAGACPQCEGFGRVIGIDENLVIPNKTLSVYEDAVMCWRGEKMSEWKRAFIAASEQTQFPIHRPYYQLTDEEKRILWEGSEGVYGINDFFKMLQENQYKIQYRVMLSRYRGKTSCPACRGSRLRPSASYVQVCGHNITQLVRMSIKQLHQFFADIQLNETDAQIASRLLTEIRNRLQFLMDVGLGYLTLDRLSSTLSGGESQRINLATSLGSSLVGSLYILDEPSIGLHSRDTGMLIKVLRQLQQLGNTVVVVEHDEEIIRAADYIIDIGPLAGRLGGEIVYQGTLNPIHSDTRSYTLRYLTGEMSIAVPTQRRPWNNYIKVEGAAENNLKNIDAVFPLRVMTVVSGVSGSGKSTLVNTILYRALLRHYGESSESPGTHARLTGDMNLVKGIEYVDQNPIGRSSRSNAATYLKAFDEIRRLYSEQQAAKQMGFNASYFSFNAEGGRCENCKGEGTITVSMQFMADITLECEHCKGKRFKQEVLDITYRDKSINDILDMTINQAIEFFEQSNNVTEKRIIKRLKPLQDVGLGYIKMGQSSSTLSGGENQRVKLAYFLSNERQEPTIFIFDEPTTGLHFHDINTLMKSLNALVERGHTVIIIEHNIDVIKCADHVIDMGLEGGDAGGEVVCCGTPEEVAANTRSYTAKYLREKLNHS
ncbi:MAG: excinuclease ABC subunit UvrA [Bacteroidaceae bacterium]|nr:excinuclease ABC subunit UvrA [Bacteroidaceae bacterium]